MRALPSYLFATGEEYHGEYFTIKMILLAYQYFVGSKKRYDRSVFREKRAENRKIFYTFVVYGKCEMIDFLPKKRYDKRVYLYIQGSSEKYCRGGHNGWQNMNAEFVVTYIMSSMPA